MGHKYEVHVTATGDIGLGEIDATDEHEAGSGSIDLAAAEGVSEGTILSLFTREGSFVGRFKIGSVSATQVRPKYTYDELQTKLETTIDVDDINSEICYNAIALTNAQETVFNKYVNKALRTTILEVGGQALANRIDNEIQNIIEANIDLSATNSRNDIIEYVCKAILSESKA